MSPFPSLQTGLPVYVFSLCVLALGIGCAPTFSELQSARLAGRGRVEITPSYSHTAFSNDGETEKVQDHFGLQLATGVSDKTDLRVRYELIKVEDDYVNVLGAGPKFGTASERFAFYAPIGFAFGSDIDMSETFQFHPTALVTIPAGDKTEVNLSGKALIPFDQDQDNLIAFNLGLGLGSDLNDWVVRPETGILINPGEDGVFWHLSLGFTKYLERNND